MASVVVRGREQDDEDVERYSKRAKIEVSALDRPFETPDSLITTPVVYDSILPPSHSLLGIPLPQAVPGKAITFLEADVGISEYIGQGDCKVEGIIKQRFTDFLVYEVDMEHRVIHLNSLGKPDSQKKKADASKTKILEGVVRIEEDADVGREPEPQLKMVLDESSNAPITANGGNKTGTASDSLEERSRKDADQDPASQIEIKDSNVLVTWDDEFVTHLSSFLSEESLVQLKQLYTEGPEPPRVSDSGWGSRPAKNGSPTTTDVQEGPSKEKDGKGNRGRGGRDKRGGKGGGRAGNARQDTRKVISNPIASKDTRTTFHKIIRELFHGKLETETDMSTPASEKGSRIVIKWAKRGGGRGGHGGKDGASGRDDRTERNAFPPYIHFTLQKSNRDTQDALGHLSRLLHVNIKDLSVAGTKDKRGVTTQRVSLKRNGKTVEEVWKLANALGTRRTLQDVLTQRGERGIRIADLNYRRSSLELGMLKGNAFVITLRNVKAASMEVLDGAMIAMKNKGFINYYGMQRFGTASVPTHAIGLALLQSNWQKAIDLIMQKRLGEHPEVEAGREAWLVDKDLDRALELLPRRVVAERCILESFKKQKGETRNAMGALSTIPRNLRLMYIHAYQSYVWNAIVSERIRSYGAEKPIPGDLVYDKGEKSDERNVDSPTIAPDELVEGEDPIELVVEHDTPQTKSRKPYVAPRVKTLTEEDVEKYTIFDVIMPLPGTDVAYPGGVLGERYKQFLILDGLDPDNFVRKQKDYTLNGSYRAILHLAKEMKWSTLRYTDPEVSLAQSDEDKLLGFDPPAMVEDGKFLALQIELTLGTAAYATMALREITKTETSSHFQTNLTNGAEDQKFRGSDAAQLDEDGGKPGSEVTENV